MPSPNEPRCTFCGDRVGGGPGGWWSLVDDTEVCRSGTSTTTFHETEDEANGVE